MRLRTRLQIPCLGGLVIDEKIAIPERHLGLVTQEDHGLLDQETIDLLADMVEKSIDLDLLVKKLPEIKVSNRLEPLSMSTRDKTVRIAVARDKCLLFLLSG